MQYNWGTILSLLVTFQLFFIAVFLLSSGLPKKYGNRFLGWFFLLLGVNIGDMLLQLNGATFFFPLFFLLDDALLLLFGPLLFWYVQATIYKDFGLTRKKWLHILPFVLCVLVLYMIYSYGAANYGQALDTIQEAKLPKSALVFVLILYGHALWYFYRSKKKLIGYGNALKERYSNVKKVDIKWLYFVLNAVVLIWVLAMVHTILPFTGLRAYLPVSLFLFVAFLFYFINAVIVKALRKPELFSDPPKLVKEKYLGSHLSDEKRTHYAKRLEELMKSDEYHSNPDLSINDFAETLGVSGKEVSQTINQSFGKNFFDFVNSYRIEQAKQLLMAKENDMTVQEIMYAVGFSSKSSFNTIFKKKTKLTPTAYRETFQK